MKYTWMIILFLICIIGILFLFICNTVKESFSTGNLKDTVRNVKYENHYLEAELKNDNNEWVYNRMEIHPLLRDKPLINNNGSFKYIIDEKTSENILSEIFPLYKGKPIPKTRVNHCVMLSISKPKYNKIRSETLNLLEEYELPPLEVYIGYTPETVHKAQYYNYMMHYKNMRYELVLGMLDVFDNFVNKYNDQNAWLLFLEDDVRPVNVEVGEDLSVLYNIPEDAELIRPYLGKNEKADMKNMTYYRSFGGGMNHAFYISVSGCKKVIHYAKKYKWRYQSDMDLYRLSRYCGGFPTNIDHGWTLIGVNNNNDISPLLTEDEKINTYSMSHLIFNQTSNPCT
jgi:hypothetical protein